VVLSSNLRGVLLMMMGVLRVLGVIVAAGVAVALTHPQLLFSEWVFGRGDAFVYFTPLWALRDAAFRAGELPLWTPSLFMGAPLLSDPQIGAFYPPNWLTINLPTPYALKIATAAHIAWALAGAYLLARRQVGLGRAAAVIAAACFGFGGYMTSHADQINQLQGMSWLPWAFLALGYAVRAPLRGLFPLAAVLGLIALTGHTQTLFISGVALGLGALTMPQPAARGIVPALGGRARLLGILAGASVLALVLAAVQFLPTLELIGLSNRSDGFSARAAMAFSWNPALAARGLLPSYDGQVFGEYVAYLGVVGLALALWGALSPDRGRWRWVILAAAGVFLALGMFNPLYWSLAELPGFNLFRVPARWLALVALGGAMLAGIGAERLWKRTTTSEGGLLGVRGVTVLVTLALLMLATWVSDRAAIEVNGPARPTLTTWVSWLAALMLLVNLALVAGRAPRWLITALTVVLVGGELLLAARNMPINDLIDPAAATDPRGTARYLREAGITGRTLSISQGYFDTYDREALVERYRAQGMSDRAIDAALTAAKLHEVVAPNLSALDGVRSVDGFGGGIVPTVYWSAFSAAVQPPGAQRSIDGRLREYLAQPHCLWACVPDPRILWLAGVEALITDKTADRFYDDIQFDVSLPVSLDAGDETTATPITPFTADQIHVLTAGDPALLTLTAGGEEVGQPVSAREVDDGLTLAVFALPRPTTVETVEVSAGGTVTVRAVTLVDARTTDYAHATLGGWRRALSSDIKLYRAANPPARAFIPQRVQVEADDWDGSERTIDVLRDPTFDVTGEAVLHALHDTDTLALPAGDVAGGVVILSETDTRIELVVSAEDGGVLILKDSYFPGWTATVDGQPATVYRANINQRGVVLPPGAQQVVFSYDPPWLRPLIALGAAAWVVLVLAAAAVWSLAGRSRRA
jgi:hypothetical protein